MNEMTARRGLGSRSVGNCDGRLDLPFRVFWSLSNESDGIEKPLAKWLIDLLVVNDRSANQGVNPTATEDAASQIVDLRVHITDFLQELHFDYVWSNPMTLDYSYILSVIGLR